RVHRHARKPLPLLDRDPELLERLEQLGVDLIEAVQLGPLLGRGVIADGLVVDGTVLDVGPVRLRHLLPVAVRLESPLDHPARREVAKLALPWQSGAFACWAIRSCGSAASGSRTPSPPRPACSRMTCGTPCAWRRRNTRWAGPWRHPRSGHRYGSCLWRSTNSAGR